MLWRRHRRRTPTRSRREIATVWQISSLLLDYPTEELISRVPMFRAALAEVDGDTAGHLSAYLDALEHTDLRELQSDYVDTFDVTRRCALHLTYFTCGDTRKRGVALIQFKQAYRKAGVEFDAAELPDHLGVVLEFGAAHDLDEAWRLLGDYRVGIELLHRALVDRESPWAGVVRAVRATLPELDGSDEEALFKLIAQGPPSEQVGIDLEPYSLDRPSFDPTLDSRLNPRPEPIDLGAAIPLGAPR